MRIVWDWGNGLRHVVLGADGPRLPWSDRLSLQVHVDTLLLSLALLDSVLLYPANEFLSRAGVRNVLDADVDALLHVLVVDTLVDDDTDGGLGYVVDNTGLSVENLEGHTVKLFSACLHLGN